MAFILSNNAENQRIGFYEYFYMFWILIYAGFASEFVRGYGDIRTWGNGFFLLLTIIFAFKQRVSQYKPLLLALGVFTLYSILSIAFSNSSEFFRWEYSKWVIYFFSSYVIVRGYGNRFFEVAERVLSVLCTIGLVFWIGLLIIPTQTINFLSLFQVKSIDQDTFYSLNSIIYTVNTFAIESGLSDWTLFARNAGFAWEPGIYACIICCGIVLNIFRYDGFKFHNNINIWIFLVSLISTESTTGFTIFGFILLIWIIQNRKYKWLFLVVPLLLYSLSLPFMGDKLSTLSEGFSTTSLKGANMGEDFSRILSFKILFDEWLSHPILGYGFSTSAVMEQELSTYSGLGTVLAQYGAVLFLLFISCLVKSSRAISCLYSSKNLPYMLVTILGMMISYRVFYLPFWMSIWMFSVYSTTIENEDNK